MIERLTAERGHAELPHLIALLQDAVHSGASIGFLAPLAAAVAEGFWLDVLRDVARETRILLVLRHEGEIVGSIQLGLCTRPNGLHRAEVQKLFVHTRWRGRGWSKLLMAAIEAEARTAQRSLLYLDTEPGQPAERLYERLGWKRAGEIPRYAATPDGALHGTAFFYREIPLRPEDGARREEEIEVIGIDHVYVSVSDLSRAETYYNQVMEALGFKKNSFVNDGDRHVQYYNRHFGFVLRPAKSAQAAHDPTRPGLHHFCFRVEDLATIEAVALRLAELGIACSPPQLYPEYAPDYWAIFFSDPDGIRLEVTNYRLERRQRFADWSNCGC